MLESSQGSLLTGKQVTLSFYARKGADYSPPSSLLLAEVRASSGTIDGNIFGTFTSPSNPISQNVTLTTSWQKFSITGVIASSVTQLAVVFVHNTVGTAGANDYYEITGVQLERGSVATSFRRNAPSIQGELAACQRYFYRMPAGVKGLGAYYGASATDFFMASQRPVPMRANGTASITSGFSASNFSVESGAASRTATTLAFVADNPNFVRIQVTTSVATSGHGGWLTGAGTIDVNAEL